MPILRSYLLTISQVWKSTCLTENSQTTSRQTSKSYPLDRLAQIMTGIRGINAFLCAVETTDRVFLRAVDSSDHAVSGVLPCFCLYILLIFCPVGSARWLFSCLFFVIQFPISKWIIIMTDNTIEVRRTWIRTANERVAALWSGSQYQSVIWDKENR